MWKRVRSLYRAFIRRRGFDDGMNEELAFHIARYADDLVRSGVSPEEAAPLGAFGTRRSQQRERGLPGGWRDSLFLMNSLGN